MCLEVNVQVLVCSSQEASAKVMDREAQGGEWLEEKRKARKPVPRRPRSEEKVAVVVPAEELAVYKVLLLPQFWVRTEKGGRGLTGDPMANEGGQWDRTLVLNPHAAPVAAPSLSPSVEEGRPGGRSCRSLPAHEDPDNSLPAGSAGRVEFDFTHRADGHHVVTVGILQIVLFSPIRKNAALFLCYFLNLSTSCFKY